MAVLRIDYNRTTFETHNSPCVPAIFDAVYFGQLSQLNKDKGAKQILIAARKEVQIVPKRANLMDVDTQSAYEELYNKFGKE